MLYATESDLRDRFGAEEISDLLGEGPAAQNRLYAALRDASALIDSVLASHYEIPLNTDAEGVAALWPALTPLACDIARERLHDENPPAAVTAAADLAQRHLVAMTDGGEHLVSGQGAEARAQINIVVRSSTRLDINPYFP